MTDPTASKLSREASAARELLISLSDDDAELRHDMTEAETGLFEAIDAALAEIDECHAIAAGCDAQIVVYSARLAKFTARAERLRGLIEQAMVYADLPSARRPMATLTVRPTKPAAIIADEALIPAKFWKAQPPKIDKAAINQAIKDGQSVPGVSMTNGGTSLQIRRV